VIGLGDTHFAEAIQAGAGTFGLPRADARATPFPDIPPVWVGRSESDFNKILNRCNWSSVAEALVVAPERKKP
jgi:hypothetical protein